MALLEVENLKTHFFGRRGVTKAVDGVDFSVEKGEIVGIVGESGSGKSVTSLSVLRLVDAPGRIVEGSIRFEGRDLLKLSNEEMRRLRGRRISMIFQAPGTSMNPVLKVGFQIAEAIRSHENVTDAEARRRTPMSPITRCAVRGPIPSIISSTRCQLSSSYGFSMIRRIASTSLTCAASMNFSPPYL